MSTAKVGVVATENTSISGGHHQSSLQSVSQPQDGPNTEFCSPEYQQCPMGSEPQLSVICLSSIPLADIMKINGKSRMHVAAQAHAARVWLKWHPLPKAISSAPRAPLQ